MAMLARCLFCGHPAESTIPDGRVCRTHAIEFWTGLVAYGAAQARVATAELELQLARVEAVYHLMPIPAIKPGPRPTRPYVKRAPKWFFKVA